ncbi:hypothetical protein PQX77_014138 [Marasmius sp. AFHP31]|nr:hypothetical protein PQX77_014138 [Marasmius sp. AFHP31]
MTTFKHHFNHASIFRLPADIQSGVCNKDIKIYDDLYDFSFWDNGQWFFMITAQTITKNQTANPNKVFTKCPPKTSSSSSTSPTASSSSTGSAESQSKSGGLGTGARAGIAVGIVALVITGALGAFFFFKRRKRTQYVSASGFSIDASPTTVSHHPPPASSASGSTSQYYSSQPPMTSSGSYFPASASAASYHPNHGVAPQHSASSTPNPQSPQSPPPLPGKSPAPNAGMTYVPAAPTSQADLEERHLDAGPVGGSSLQKKTSGRLPPAYGDLMWDSS